MIIPLAFAWGGLVAALWWACRTMAGRARMPLFMLWLLPTLGLMLGGAAYGLLWRLV